MLIPLRLTDHRGRHIDAHQVRDLKIWVWTQRRELYLVFHARDVRHEHDEDILVIPEFKMASLQPGVVIYKYEYKDPMGHGHHGIKEETVITDIIWKGATPDGRPLNPVNYESLEYLQDKIEEVDRRFHRKLDEVKTYVEVEYTNGLEEEVERSTKIDEEFEDRLSRLAKTVETLSDNFTEETADRTDIKLLIEKETTRAKDEENRIETKVDRYKDLAQKRLEEIQSIMAKEREEREAASRLSRQNADAIAVINGDDSTIGSIAHSLKESKHYTNDKVHQVKDKTKERLKKAVKKSEEDLNNAMEHIKEVPVSLIKSWFLS